MDGRVAFGRMVAEALKGRGMKQEDLAQSLGTTQSSVSGWINGKYEPPPATVFTIESALGVDPGSFSRPLGYLPVETAAGPISVEAAIAQCTLLDDEAKAAIAALYRVLATRSGSSAAPTAPPRHLPRATRDRLAVPPATNARRRSMASGT